MSDSEPASDPRSAYAEGIKWALALCIAGVSGAFLHLSDLSKLPFCLRVVAATAAGAFLAAAFFGAQYLIRIFTDVVRKHDLDEIANSVTEADKARAQELREKLAKSDKSRPKLYRLQTTFACIGAFLALVFLPAAILDFHDDPKKPDNACTVCNSSAQPVADRYSVVLSAVHPGSRGVVMQHTFLLDKQTGRIWQMVCQKGGLVVFHEVPRIPAP